MPSHEITCYTPRHRIPYHVLGLYERARRSCIARHSFTCSPTSSPLSLSFSLSIDRSPIYCSLQILTVLLSIGKEGDGNVFPLYLAVLSLRATQIFPSLRIHYIFFLLSSFLFLFKRRDWILLYSFFSFLKLGYVLSLSIDHIESIHSISVHWSLRFIHSTR